MPKTPLKLALICCFIVAMGYIFLMRKNDRKSISLGLASTKQSNVIVYVAPSIKANKLWKLNHAHWPIIVLEISKNWAKITDAYNTTGWIHKRNIEKPYALILKETFATESYQKKDNKKIARLLPNASVPFLGQINQQYCKIMINKQHAYVSCDDIFFK